tara:strand:- start:388 stop:615 length:228 start_codon:yes stop_codon:yes gene_type:complete
MTTYQLNKEQFRSWQEFTLMNEKELYKTKSGFINEFVEKDNFLVHFDEKTVSTEVLDFFEKTLDLPKGSRYNKQH